MFTERLESNPKPDPGPARKCRVGMILDHVEATYGEQEHAALEEIIRAWRVKDAGAVLRDEGYPHDGSVLLDHRNKRCRCFAPLTVIR